MTLALQLPTPSYGGWRLSPKWVILPIKILIFPFSLSKMGGIYAWAPLFIPIFILTYFPPLDGYHMASFSGYKLERKRVKNLLFKSFSRHILSIPKKSLFFLVFYTFKRLPRTIALILSNLIIPLLSISQWCSQKADG